MHIIDTSWGALSGLRLAVGVDVDAECLVLLSIFRFSSWSFLSSIFSSILTPRFGLDASDSELWSLFIEADVDFFIIDLTSWLVSAVSIDKFSVLFGKLVTEVLLANFFLSVADTDSVCLSFVLLIVCLDSTCCKFDADEADRNVFFVSLAFIHKF